MGHCISFGECYPNFVYLYILNFILLIGSIISLYLADIYSLNEKGAHGNILFILFLIYLSLSFFYFIQLIMNKCIFKKRTNNNIRHQINRITKYIFNDSSERINCKDFIKIFFISIILLIAETLRMLFTEISFVDSFSSLLFFSFILSVCRDKYYKHQYFSIIITLIMKIISYVVQGFHMKVNFPFDYFCFQIFASFLESVFLMNIERLMKYNYFFLPCRILYIIGMINTFLLCIFSLILYYFQINY